MIVVIDTNVWVLALQFGNGTTVPERAMELARHQDTVATSDDIDAEVRRIFTEKFGWSLHEVDYALQLVLHRSVRVTLEHNVKACRDPKDNMFLECAQRANADLIVAGDKDLLVLGSFSGAKIVTPAQYLQLPR